MSRAKTLNIVGFGDSLMAGYQLPEEDGFTAKLEKALKAKGYDVAVVNAGVSGDTTTGGLARLDWSVGEDADGVVLQLGANDALRGIDPAIVRSNLKAMIETLQQRQIPVLLAGMVAPPNMGGDYGERYNSIFSSLADEYGLILYPFFLEGVAAEPTLSLADGMHPNAEGVDVMVASFLPHAERFLKEIGEGTKGGNNE